jgi:hypothetical protein
MKKLLFSIAALVFTTAIFAQKKSDDVAKFKTETLELGKLKQDVPTAGVFEVTNIGKEPLLIEQANPTCGCTISDYTKTPIEPGQTGTIKATYNAKNIGMFEKHLTVKFAGCEDMKSITIKGEVIKNEDAPAAAPAAAPAKAEVATEKPAVVTEVNKADAPKKATKVPASNAAGTKVKTETKKP